MHAPPMAVQQQVRKARLAFETVARIRRASENEVKALLGAVLNRAVFGQLNGVSDSTHG